MAETLAEFTIGVALFTLGYRGYTGKWPWEQKP
jgi:hypothetical protein